jgi:hypothetical protein
VECHILKKIAYSNSKIPIPQNEMKQTGHYSKLKYILILLNRLQFIWNDNNQIRSKSCSAGHTTFTSLWRNFLDVLSDFFYFNYFS